MAIIKCIECGHDVSTLADKCPNCGCPVTMMLKSEQHSEDKFDIILERTGKHDLEVIRFIREIASPKRGLQDAINIIESLPQTIISSVSRTAGQEVVDKLSQLGCSVRLEESNNCSNSANAVDGSNVRLTFLFTKDEPLKCPRCGSTAVTTTSRGYSLIWGFAGSNKTVNRCGKCGYTWKP